MVNTVQHKRGTTAQVNSYTGAVGEFIYNTTTKRIHAQDGLTAGGIPHALVGDVDLKANASVTISAGSGLTGGGTIAANRTLALSSASIASLAKADTAVQSVNGKSGSAVSLVKGDIGLGNVDNTSDSSKPISTATQTALNAKANSSVTVTAGSGLTGGGNLTANRTVALNAASIASLAKADSAIQAPGGSTGQILSKSSNTTNDVVWVSSEAATAVSYGPQTLTAPQKTQARDNIEAQQSGTTLEALRAATGAAANQLPYMTSGSAAAFTTLTAFARTLLDDADGASMFATIGFTYGTNWFKLPSKHIVQWGSSTGITDVNGLITVTFPTSFLDPTSYNVACWNGDWTVTGILSNVRTSGWPLAGGIQVRFRNPTTNAVITSQSVRVDWIAIGMGA